jgi:hypothetical protein
VTFRKQLLESDFQKETFRKRLSESEFLESDFQKATSRKRLPESKLQKASSRKQVQESKFKTVTSRKRLPESEFQKANYKQTNLVGLPCAKVDILSNYKLKTMLLSGVKQDKIHAAQHLRQHIMEYHRSKNRTHQ